MELLEDGYMIVRGLDVPTGIRRDNTLARPLRDIEDVRREVPDAGRSVGTGTNPAIPLRFIGR